MSRAKATESNKYRLSPTEIDVLYRMLFDASLPISYLIRMGPMEATTAEDQFEVIRDYIHEHICYERQERQSQEQQHSSRPQHKECAGKAGAD